MLYAMIILFKGLILISCDMLTLFVLISRNAFLYLLKKSMKFLTKFVILSSARLSQSYPEKKQILSFVLQSIVFLFHKNNLQNLQILNSLQN